MLRAVFSNSRHLEGNLFKLHNSSAFQNSNSNLLSVIFTQLHQLLTFVVFDAVQHSVHLSRFSFSFVISVAKRATVHTDQLDDSKPDEDFSYDLEY